MRNVTRMMQTLLAVMLMVFVFGTQGIAQTTLLTESFDGGSGTTPPTGWATEQVSGTSGSISFVTTGTYPSVTPYDGTSLVDFNSYNCPTGNSTRLKRTTALSTVGYTNVAIDFAWYEDAIYSNNDRVDVQWSVDGTNWTTAATFSRYNAVQAWKIKNVTLPSGAQGQATLYIAFTFISDWGNDCHLDLAHVTAIAPPAPVTVTIGTGTSTVSYPYETLWMDARTQLLYTSSEIQAAGGAPGEITTIGFYVSSRNAYLMNGFNVRLQNTTSDAITSFVTDGWSTCYTGTYTVPGTGWQLITLQTPFVWDGSNLLLEICFDNTGYGGNSTVRATTTSANRVRYYYTDNNTGCSMTNNNTSTSRPNLRFNVTPWVGTITGTVTDSYFNTPVAGATISVPGMSAATTNASGAYTMYNVPVGAKNVTASAANYVSQTKQTVIQNQVTNTVDFNLDNIPGVLTGIVTNASTGNPIVGAKVSVSNQYGEFSTLSTIGGNYTLNVFPVGGPWSVTGSKAGYDDLPLGPFTFAQGNTINQDFPLLENTNPPTNIVAALNTGETAVNLTWGLPNGNYEQIYDDGIAENWTVWAVSGNMNAVKFTPVGYPATVTGGKVNIGTVDNYPSGSNPLVPFQIAVYDASGTNGLPGVGIDTIDVTPTDFGWVEFTFNTPITITSGSFYLVMIQGGNAPNAAGIAVDETTPQLRSYSKFETGGGPWVPAGGNFMMRALMNGPGGPLLADNSDATITSGISEGAIYQHTPATVSGSQGVGQVVWFNDNGDVITGYQVYRLQQGEEATPGVWTSVGTTSAMNLTDNSWPSLACGPYRWAVESVFTGNRISPAAFSNVLGKCWTAGVTINVNLTCTATAPEGTKVTLQNTAYPDTMYVAMTDTNGQVVFSNVWKGNYTLSISRFNYDPYTQVVDIMGDMTLDVNLLQVKTPPTNLFVDNQTLEAVWNQPRVFETFFTETWSSGSFTTNGWVKDPASGSNWSIVTGTGNPAPSVEFNYSPQVFNYNQYLTSKLLTNTLGAPGVMVKYDIYLNNYGTTYENTMAIEVWDGISWHTMKTYTNMDGDMPWTTDAVDISAYADDTFKIRFHAAGEDSYDIDNWNIDNISLIGTDGVTGMNPCILGYNFYLNNVLDGFVQDTTYSIPKTHVQYGQNYDACVSAVYGSGYSTQSCYNFTSDFLFPPRNLAVQGIECNAYLTWEKPAISDGISDNQAFPPATGTGPATDFGTGNSEGLDMSYITGPTDALYDNGPMVNSPGTGANGADESVLQSGLGNFGSNFNQSLGYSLSDDFVVPAGGGWDPTKFTFFGYQTGAPNTGSFTGVYFRIYDGQPGAGGNVIWGDLTTNRMTNQSFSNIYRVSSVGGGTDRAIITLECDNISGLHLAPGTYWVEAQATGSLSSGPWMSYITINGQLSTGNGLQGNNGSYSPLVDGSYTQGIPFIIDGPGGSTGGTPEGIIGYNVYRDEALVAYVSGADTTWYYDMNLDPDNYVYAVTAVYDLTSYGFPGETDESLIEGPDTVSILCGRPLPFYEPWDQASFSYNNWTFSAGQGNWVMNSGEGNPAPTADFSWLPMVTDYSYSLESPVLNAGPYTCASMWFDFDYKLVDRNATGDEKLVVEVFYNGTWHQKAEYANNGSVDWTSEHFDISAIQGKALKVRFVASGAKSEDILHWYVDNIHVYGICNSPVDLTGSAQQYNVTLTWTPPTCEGGGGGTLMQFIYDDGTAENGWGINAGYQSWIGNEFPLASTYNGVIQSFDVWFGFAASNSMQLTIDVFDATQTVVGSSDAFTTPYEDWTTVNCNDIPFSGMFYGMVKWDNLSSSTNYFGIDEDGSNSGLDLEWYYDGSTWDKFSNMGYNGGVFLIRATALVGGDLKTVELTAGQKPTGHITNTAALTHIDGYFDTKNYGTTHVIDGGNADSSQIAGYNVYRTDINSPSPFNKLNASPVTAATYLDVVDPFEGTYQYYVTTLFNDSQANSFLCESPGSDTISVVIFSGINDPNASNLSVYPNPATEVVNVKSTATISSIEVMNYVGQMVFTMNNVDSKTAKVNVTTMRSGVYFVKVTTSEGIHTTKITVTH